MAQAGRQSWRRQAGWAVGGVGKLKTPPHETSQAHGVVRFFGPPLRSHFGIDHPRYAAAARMYTYTPPSLRPQTPQYVAQECSKRPMGSWQNSLSDGWKKSEPRKTSVSSIFVRGGWRSPTGDCPPCLVRLDNNRRKHKSLFRAAHTPKRRMPSKRGAAV